MGYRPTIIKEYNCEYGNTLSGYNHSYNKFSEFLDKIGVCYYENEAEDAHEIRTKDLLRLDGKFDKLHLNESEHSNLKSLIDIAKNAKYAKTYDCVKIAWF